MRAGLIPKLVLNLRQNVAVYRESCVQCIEPPVTCPDAVPLIYRRLVRANVHVTNILHTAGTAMSLGCMCSVM